MSFSQQEPKLGALLVSEGLIRESDVELALERQKENGGLLGEILVALGIITRPQLESVFQTAPLAPRHLPTRTPLRPPPWLPWMQVSQGRPTRASAVQRIQDSGPLPQRVPSTAER